jgi:hypothetical protein
MRRSFKIAAVAAALAMPASLAAVSLSGTAGAATPVACSKLSGNINTTIKVTGAKCKAKPPKAYKTLSGTAGALASGGTLTWNDAGASITISAPTLSQTATCPKGWTEETANGTIASATDAAGITYDANLVGTDYSAEICFNNKSGAVKLVKKTKFQL